MFGSHLSIAGGLHNALLEAKRLRMDCVQIFTKNQRQWAAPPLTDEQVAAWHQVREKTKINDVVSHDSYLINLASPKRDVREKSIRLFRDEIERCEALAIPYLVTHPGAHLGIGVAQGLQRVIKAFDRLHRQLRGYKTITCLEITAGQGTSLGYEFEHLKRIITDVKDSDRLAVCLDTAHMLAAGYDLTSAKGCQATLDELDDLLGIELVKCVHMNDSKVERGSRVDRHEHIGHGYVALDAFRVIVDEPHLSTVPKILETAKEDAPSGKPWDAVNLQKLKRLRRRKRKMA